MAKKVTLVITATYDEYETDVESAIDSALFNTDGMIGWHIEETASEDVD